MLDYMVHVHRHLRAILLLLAKAWCEITELFEVLSMVTVSLHSIRYLKLVTCTDF